MNQFIKIQTFLWRAKSTGFHKAAPEIEYNANYKVFEVILDAVSDCFPTILSLKWK